MVAEREQAVSISDSTAPQQQRTGEPVDLLRSKVLLYLGDNRRAAEFIPLADGVIYRGRSGFSAARKAAKPRPFAAVDPERYAHDRGPEPNELVPLTAEEAVRAQLATGAALLIAPSRFPKQGDANAFRQMLEEGRAFIETAARIAPALPAFVTIVVRYDDVAKRVWIDELAAAELPVATVFAGFLDPLSTYEAIRGAIDLIAACPHTMLLRSDLSVGGLSAHGADGRAIGTSSTVRHLWLPSGGKSSSPSDFHALVPGLGAWEKGRVLAAAAAEPDFHDIFGCECATCGPDGDVRNLIAFERADDDRVALFERHSAHSSVLLVKKILGADNPKQEWSDHLDRWHANFAKLRAAGISLTEPPMLTAWRRAIGRA